VVSDGSVVSEEREGVDEAGARYTYVNAYCGVRGVECGRGKPMKWWAWIYFEI